MLIGENGWLNRRLNYVKCQQKSVQQQSRQNQPAVSTISHNELEDFEYLKRVKVDDANQAEVIAKLDSTRDLRKRMMTVPETDIREHFSIFLAHPKLVS